MTNEQTKPSNDIIRKIQNLLNLGKRGGTEAEAALAMEKAQELLTKYNLDMSTINSTEVEGGTVKLEEKREKETTSNSAMYEWQQKLCRAICEANYCWYWVSTVYEETGKRLYEGGPKATRKVKRHTILGREANVIAVKFMYQYLVDTLEELLPYPNAERLSRAATSWRLGAIDRLIRRIEQKAYDMAHPKEEATTVAKTFGVATRNLQKSEYEANYDHQYGKGAYARAVERYNARKAEEAAKVDTRTEAQKRKEEEKQRKASDRYWEKQRREQQRKASRIDIAAYCEGKKVGDSISLQDRINK